MAAFREGHPEPGWPSQGTFGPYTGPHGSLGNDPDDPLTVHVVSDHDGFKRCGLAHYKKLAELVVVSQSRALEAFVVESSVYRKLKLLNFVIHLQWLLTHPGLHQPWCVNMYVCIIAVYVIITH